MMQALEVAGVSLGLDTDQPVPGKLAGKHEFFVQQLSRATIELKVDTAINVHTNAPVLFDSQSVWKVHQLGEQLLYTFSSPAFRPEIYKHVQIDTGYTRGTLSLPGKGIDTSRAIPHPLDAPMDQLLLSHHFATRGHVELHCCTLKRNGKAIVLTGFSGAGKTTAARLWSAHRPDVKILSDDRVIIRRDGSSLNVWGTPWCGEGQFALNERAPLGAVIFLRHGTDNSLTPMDPRVAARELYARTFPPAWNVDAVNAVLTTITSMASSVPVFNFSCRADVSAVEALERALDRA